MTIRCVLSIAFLAVLSMDSSVKAAWVRVDNFQSFSDGQEIDGVNGWNAPLNGSSTTNRRVIDDPTEGGTNLVLQVKNDGPRADDTTGLHSFLIHKELPAVISDSSTAATLFWRAYIPEDRIGSSSVNKPDWTITLIDSIDNDFSQGPAVLIDSHSSATGGAFEVYHDVIFHVIDEEIIHNAWHEFWMVVNNDEDTWELFVRGGAYATRTQIAVANGDRKFTFRNPQGDIETFLMRVNVGQVSSEHYFIDDIYLDATRRRLITPLPEPTAGGLAVLALCGVGFIRKSR